MSGDGSASRWSQLSHKPGPAEYDDRFRALAAQGIDVHGEALFCTRLKSPPARVVDVGCGTGRVSLQLARLGFDCLGLDSDAVMLERAIAVGPVAPSDSSATAGSVRWFADDIAMLAKDTADQCRAADVVIAAGNVIPLLAPGTLTAAIDNCRTMLKSDGVFVTGFGIDQAHLPAGCPVTALADYDRACDRAGLALMDRYSTWQGEAFTPGGGYVVSVHTVSIGAEGAPAAPGEVP